MLLAGRDSLYALEWMTLCKFEKKLFSMFLFIFIFYFYQNVKL